MKKVRLKRIDGMLRAVPTKAEFNALHTERIKDSIENLEREEVLHLMSRINSVIDTLNDAPYLRLEWSQKLFESGFESDGIDQLLQAVKARNHAPQPISLVFQAVSTLRDFGLDDHADILVRISAKAYPHNLNLQVTNAGCLLAQGNIDSGIQELEKLYSSYGEAEQVIRQLASAYCIDGRANEALELLDKHLELVDRSPALLQSEAYACSEAADIDRYRSIKPLIGSSNPDYADYLEAKILFLLGDNRAASKLLEPQVIQKPNPRNREIALFKACVGTKHPINVKCDQLFGRKRNQRLNQSMNKLLDMQRKHIEDQSCFDIEVING